MSGVGLAMLVFAPAGAKASPAEGSAAQRRVGLAPVIVSGDTAAHIDTHFDERVRMAMAADGLELVDLAPHWSEGCDASPCISVAADQGRAEYVVRASVFIEERDYVMHIGLYNRSGFEVQAVDATCEICTYAEAAERLGFEVAAFRGRLMMGGAELASGSRSGDTDAEAEESGEKEADEGGVGRLGRRQAVWTGAGLLGGGVALIAGGATMMALEEKNYGPKCSAANTDPAGNCEFRYQTLEGGIGLAVAGVGAAIGGAVLIGLAQRKGKSVEVALRPGLTHVTLEGRF